MTKNWEYSKQDGNKLLCIKREYVTGSMKMSILQTFEINDWSLGKENKRKVVNDKDPDFFHLVRNN